MIEVSYNLEDYDHELDVDVAQVGIHTAPLLEPHMEGPVHMVERVRNAVRPFLEMGKLVGLLGGEHSITIGSVGAMAEHHPDLSVLYLDAHADLREQYMGTGWGHASVARRVSEICPVTQVGVRSISQEEMEYVRRGYVHTTFWPPSGHSVPTPAGSLDGHTPPYVSEVIGRLSSSVYISIDLDVLDPAIMSAVGTPEPGGMGWYQVTALLRAVAEQRRVVGFDVTELSPGQGTTADTYTAAKLVYKLVAYATLLPGAREPSVRKDRIPG